MSSRVPSAILTSWCWKTRVKGLVVVDFWAPWAGPSLRQQNLLKALANQYNGRFLLVTVNTDQQKGIASRFGVKTPPSFKLFRNARVVEAFHGMQPEADYRTIVDRHLVPLGDKVRLAAARAWDHGQYDKAIQVLAEGAVADPENLDIPSMLAKLLMRVHRYDEARGCWSRCLLRRVIQPSWPRCAHTWISSPPHVRSMTNRRFGIVWRNCRRTSMHISGQPRCTWCATSTRPHCRR